MALLFGGLSLLQSRQIKALRGEGERLERSLSSALTECQTWRDKDSLSRGRAEALELSLREYQKLLSESASEVAKLKERNRDLSRVTESQSETIIHLKAQAKDTIVIRDSVPIQAKHVSCGDAWYTFDGMLSGDDFTGTLENRDSLILVESVRYARFLWWKTKRIKDIRVDVEQRNPYTEILGLRHIVISEK